MKSERAIAKRRILVIDGHPDSRAGRFVHACAQAYMEAAAEAGHQVKAIRVAELGFDWLKTNEDLAHGEPPRVIRSAQEDFAWCDHLVIVYPLWLGSMPALLKAFFEQLLRPGFAFKSDADGKLPKKLLTGKSARIVVTMGMPSIFYKWVYRAHSLKSLERNILAFVGFGPIRASVIGGVEGNVKTRERWLQRLRQFAAVGK
jgi:putative NADPH-quinone reductase